MAIDRKWVSYLPWALAGSLAITLAWMLDGPVDDALNVSGQPFFIHFAQQCSRFGEGWVPALLGILLVILFMARHRPAVAAKISFVVITCELTGLVAVILRVFAGRARPDAHVPQGFYGMWHDGHWLIGKYEFSSFPSGHTATAVGLAAATWLVSRGWGAVASLFALIVMWARIALGCHHFSDVVASTVLAIPLAILFKKTLWPTVELQFVNPQLARKKFSGLTNRLFASKKHERPLNDAAPGPRAQPADLRIK